MEVKENFYKADVFALGLCVLEAATLRKSSEIYDIKGKYNTIFLSFN